MLPPGDCQAGVPFDGPRGTTRPAHIAVRRRFLAPRRVDEGEPSLLAEHRQRRPAEQAERREQAHGHRHGRGGDDTPRECAGLERPRHVEHELEHHPRERGGEQRAAQARCGAEARVLDGERARDGSARGFWWVRSWRVSVVRRIMAGARSSGLGRSARQYAGPCRPDPRGRSAPARPLPRCWSGSPPCSVGRHRASRIACRCSVWSPG